MPREHSQLTKPIIDQFKINNGISELMTVSTEHTLDGNDVNQNIKHKSVSPITVSIQFLSFDGYFW